MYENGPIQHLKRRQPNFFSTIRSNDWGTANPVTQSSRTETREFTGEPPSGT